MVPFHQLFHFDIALILLQVVQIYLGDFTRGVLILISTLGIGSFLLPLWVFMELFHLLYSIYGRFLMLIEIRMRGYSPAKGNIICKNCNRSNIGSSQFCTKCGNKIQNNCINCKNLNMMGISFRGKCGVKLSSCVFHF